MLHRSISALAFVLFVGAAASQPTAAAATPSAQAATTWTASWSASPQPSWPSTFILPLGTPTHFQDQSLRQFLRLSLGARRLRVEFSNAHGTAPLHIAAAALALAGPGASTQPSSTRVLRFSGSAEAIVPAGAYAVSDPVDLPVADGTRLAISLYLPSAALAGFHFDARDTMFIARGNRVADEHWPGDTPSVATRAFVSAVHVENDRAHGAVVALGDSLTDGNGATPGGDHRWTDALAARLTPRGLAVLNAGISGNRLLRDGMGESGLARMRRDVFAQPGVHTLVVLLGTNDIGWPGGPFAPEEPAVTVEQLIAGYRQLIEQARVHGLRVIGATLPPFEGALAGTPLEGHHSPAKEALRQQINRWLRSTDAFDAVVDLDRVLRDPGHPTRLRPAYDSGDHLHPSDAGYQVLAAALDEPGVLQGRRAVPGSPTARGVSPP